MLAFSAAERFGGGDCCGRALSRSAAQVFHEPPRSSCTPNPFSRLRRCRDPGQCASARSHSGRGARLALLPTKEFGGFSSALAISSDGREIIALADNGTMAAGTGRDLRRTPRRDCADAAAGAPDAGGRQLCAERASTTLRASPSPGGIAYVGIEREHGVIRFAWDREGVAARRRAAPECRSDVSGCRQWRARAVAVVPTGIPLAGSVARRRRAIAEGDDTPTQGFFLTGPRGELRGGASGGFDITDMAFLPNGELLLLERRFSYLAGFAIRLRRVAAGAIRPGPGRRDGRVRERRLSQIDNMEGLAIHREGRDTVADHGVGRQFQRHPADIAAGIRSRQLTELTQARWAAGRRMTIRMAP